MPTDGHGGCRSRKSRRQSRDLISGFRAERLARKRIQGTVCGADAAATPPVKAAASEPGASVSDLSETSAALDYAVSGEAVAFASRAAPSQDMASPVAEAEVPSDDDAPDEPGNVDTYEPGATAAPVIPDQTPEIGEKSPDEPLVEPPAPGGDLASSVSKDETDPCDLLDLPGAGPGLVWILQRADIHSLADLACADPAALGEKLGLIGQLVDLRSWIAFAAERRPSTTAE